MNFCIFLTGTMIPNIECGSYDEALSLRRKQYLKALQFYRKIFTQPLYFLENSSYDFSQDPEFTALFSQGVHLIKFPISSESQKGKGYQEFQMIDEALDRIPTYDSILKITGRYLYTNIQSVMNPLMHNGITIDMYRRPKVAITSIFHVGSEFYRAHIKGAYLEVNDAEGEWIERILYRRFSKLSPNIVSLFPVQPQFEIEGSSKNSRENPFKVSVRNAQRWVGRNWLNQLY